MNKNEYREILINLHLKNQEFVDKAIFSISSMAIPVLISLLDKLKSSIFVEFFFCATLISFIITVAMHLHACNLSKEACNLSLNEEKREKGNELFDKAEKEDKIKFIVFLISLILFVLTIVINFFVEEKLK
ncbi:MAG: hypothetical protein EOM53_04260 [Alphaproteobacteria bacterium]|nr:hypothetical protein [Alphaproteobacteria bacterium]